ncbi:proline dehydrogenase family protein [Haloferax larsenii]|uniref:proline dehydrogenase n=1 Tax=Haloferax larsenii TaxID=302484 RepID=A0ABY5RGJ4_HALLR|nr:proline dehydrogenase family protein [Haloferax larsenii]ELZ75478.1 proline dehydrogenase [Haloferax larsenii JCM 13917]UVE51496.1 proline dehydrogenase family protein [Haloferax larsenii]
MIPPIASKFVAGESPAEALDHARQMNDEGVAVILNLLGEHYHERGPADEDADAYVQLVEDIAETDLDACVSVKPSQIGLDMGDDVFAENYRRIAEAADEHDVFLWCDMEDHETTDATLDSFEELAREFEGGMGLCVQANLKRTPDDLERLSDVPGKIRLVKGAYDEPASVAHKKKAKVDEVYKELLAYLFREYTGSIAVGSHDPEMISYARELGQEYDTDYEIQMLMGVREDAQRDLASEGVEVWQYAPYGGKWFQYFYRRVRERKENALFAIRAVLGI